MPKLLVYALSFTFLAIYWNNHHHLMQVVERVDGRVLWANTALLFSLSLTPAATAWLGPKRERHRAGGGLRPGSALVGRRLLRVGPNSAGAPSPRARLATAIGSDRKGRFSAIAYSVAIAVAFFAPYVAIAIYVGVAVVWLVPDSRITRVIGGSGGDDDA